MSLKTFVLEPPKRTEKVYWLVECFAEWCPPCIEFTGSFSELSNMWVYKFILIEFFSLFFSGSSLLLFITGWLSKTTICRYNESLELKDLLYLFKYFKSLITLIIWLDNISYDKPSLRFARIDVGRHQKAAKDLKVDTSAMTKQLPSVILFRGGKEIKRIPPIDESGKVIKRVFLDKVFRILKWFPNSKRAYVTIFNGYSLSL